jgi:hypothetical protein
MFKAQGLAEREWVDDVYAQGLAERVQVGDVHAHGLAERVWVGDVHGHGLAERVWVGAEFQKVGILGSRIPDIFCEKSGHFWLRPEIRSIYRYLTFFHAENET